jgi:hypothetical protein
MNDLEKAKEGVRERAGLEKKDGRRCVCCKKELQMGINVFTNAGLKETHISGFCEICFNNLDEGVDE